MALVTLEEFHISLLVKSTQSEAIVKAMTRITKSRTFQRQLQVAVNEVIRQHRELTDLRIKIGR